MSETKACCCGGDNKPIFACPGASNVGQLANDVAQNLAKNGEGSMSCIAANGARLDGFVVSARDGDPLDRAGWLRAQLRSSDVSTGRGRAARPPDLHRAYDVVMEKMRVSAC